ncbi:hypothetical protein B0H19DRAFT_1373798, partial [Mycena capillaripes]
MSYLFNISALIASIRGEEHNEANSRICDESGRELQFYNEFVHLDKFLVLQRALVTDYNRIISEEIFFGEPIPEWYSREIDIRSLVDDPRNNSAGYCFIDHPQNGFTPMFVYYGEWLLSCPIRAAKFTYEIDGTLAWKSGPCYRLLESFVRLRYILCNRKIIDVGPSVRATEIARDLLRNLSGASLRSLLIFFHMVVIVGIQDKMSHKILKKRFTPGAPSLETALELIRNLVFFRRFESDHIRYFKGDVHAERYNMYLWPDIDANITGDTISQNLGDATEEHVGVRLQILDYRHVTSAFMGYHFGPLMANVEADRPHDLLANHSTRTANQKYGVDRDDGVAGNHWAPRQQASFAYEQKALDGPLLPDIAAEAPATPSTLSASDVAAIVRQTLIQEEPKSWERMKPVLNDFLVDLASTHFPKIPPPPLPHALRAPTSIIVDVSRLADLREFLNDERALWKYPEQGEFIELLRTSTRPILAILPCDFGKTMLIMMHAKMYESHLITIVILPLSGLHRDFHNRAAESHIRVSEYDGPQNNYDAISILYVSVERAVNDIFLRFAEALAHRKRLGRIILDEADILLTGYAYREPMKKFIKVLGVLTHITALSATMPPQLIRAFCEITGVPDWNIIRMPTTRPNVTYHVSVCPANTHIDAAINYVQNRLASDAYKGTNNNIMVFCRTKALTDDVAKRLGTQGYHSETPIETRTKLFDDFKNHVTNVLTGTSLIGRGIDQPVTDVVHIDVGWSIMDQVQEDNRGGRQSRPTRAMYFVPENRQPIPPDPVRPFGCELLVRWAPHPTECRRLALSLFLDGVGYTCMSIKNMALCDNCLRKAHDPTRVAPSLPLPTPIRNPEDYGNIDLVGASRGLAMSKTAPRATGRALGIAAPLLGATSMPVAAAQTNDQEHLNILSPPGCDSDEEEPQDFFGLFSAPIATRREPAPPSSPPSSPSWDPLSTLSLMRS